MFLTVFQLFVMRCGWKRKFLEHNSFRIKWSRVLQNEEWLTSWKMLQGDYFTVLSDMRYRLLSGNEVWNALPDFQNNLQINMLCIIEWEPFKWIGKKYPDIFIPKSSTRISWSTAEFSQMNSERRLASSSFHIVTFVWQVFAQLEGWEVLCSVAPVCKRFQRVVHCFKCIR